MNNKLQDLRRYRRIARVVLFILWSCVCGSLVYIDIYIWHIALMFCSLSWLLSCFFSTFVINRVNKDAWQWEKELNIIDIIEVWKAALRQTGDEQQRIFINSIIEGLNEDLNRIKRENKKN